MVHAQATWLHIALLVTFAAVAVWSVIYPYKLFNWLLEMAPVLAGAIVLVATYRRFQLTDLAYVLLWIVAGRGAVCDRAGDLSVTERRV